VEPLTVALALLWVTVLALAVAVIALARQVGVLFERVAPMGALMTDAGPKVGEATPRFDLVALGGQPIAVGAAAERSMLLFFLSPTCPVCKKLLPILRSAQRSERHWLDIVLASDGERANHEAFVKRQALEAFPYALASDLGMTYRVNRLPYAVLIDGDGIVRAKGLVNNREQLESLFNAKELGIASIQGYLERTPAGANAPEDRIAAKTR
jgi:methylamine dehydrogenase accessory protein MauD